jgi:hypothetical protein
MNRALLSWACACVYVRILCACVGRAIVEGLWRHGGFQIIIACRSIEQGVETAKEIREGGQGSGELEVLYLLFTTAGEALYYCFTTALLELYLLFITGPPSRPL